MRIENFALPARRSGRLGASVAMTAFFALATGAQAALVISTAPTANVTCTAGSCTQGPGGPGVLNVTQLRTMLASSDVTVQARTSLVVEAEIAWASTSTLTLDAPAALVIKWPIIVAGTGGLALDTGNELAPIFGPKGYVSFWSTSSRLSITLPQPTRTIYYTLVDSIAELASAAAANPNGNFALANSYNAAHDGIYSASPIPTFTGYFTALNNTISNLSIHDNTVGDHVGLFGETGSAWVSSLNLTNAVIRGANNSDVGGIAGVNNATLVADSVNGRISTGNSQTGSQGAVAGGLAGVNYGKIELAFSTGSITGGKNAILGGAVGENATTSHKGGGVAAVYSTAAVTLDTGSCADCKIGNPRNSAGGLVGANEGYVVTSYATGAVTGGPSSNVGGVIGFEGSISTFQVAQAYSTSAVIGGAGSSVGGAIGFDKTPGVTVNYYWDTTTSNISSSTQGSGNIANDSGIEALTTTQLQAGLPEGFDARIWGQNAEINGGLPNLFLVGHL